MICQVGVELRSRARVTYLPWQATSGHRPRTYILTLTQPVPRGYATWQSCRVEKRSRRSASALLYAHRIVFDGERGHEELVHVGLCHAWVHVPRRRHRHCAVVLRNNIARTAMSARSSLTSGTCRGDHVAQLAAHLHTYPLALRGGLRPPLTYLPPVLHAHLTYLSRKRTERSH